MGRCRPGQITTIGRTPPSHPVGPVDLARHLLAWAPAAHITDLGHRNQDETDVSMTHRVVVTLSPPIPLVTDGEGWEWGDGWYGTEDGWDGTADGSGGRDGG